ncbi:unnamed protein product, partial [Thlaspi arvense]
GSEDSKSKKEKAFAFLLDQPVCVASCSFLFPNIKTCPHAATHVLALCNDELITLCIQRKIINKEKSRYTRKTEEEKKGREQASERERDMRSSSSCVVLFMCLMLLSSSVDAYKNYTVGESTGWFDIQERPSANYQRWADSKSFSLGDFLNSNHSVVQTYDYKTYKECDYNNGEDNSTTEWSGANPSATSPVPVSVNVPLVKEGSNYFFSGNYDGEQCKFGQHFMINVTHGQGLPALSSPDEDDAPGPGQASQSGDDEVAPDTIVPANFDHPKDIESDDDDDNLVKGRKNSSSITKYNLLCLFFMGLLASFF